MKDQISKAGVNDLIISMYEVIEEECNVRRDRGLLSVRSRFPARFQIRGFVFLKSCGATVMFPDYENNSHP